MTKKHTPIKYLLILAILLAAAICSLSGCGDDKESEKEENPLLEKIYWHNNFDSDLELDYIKFYDDSTMQGLEVIEKGYSVSSYGTYELHDPAITMNIGDKSYSGVVLDDGDSIQFGSDKYIDYTEQITSNPKNKDFLKNFKH